MPQPRAGERSNCCRVRADGVSIASAAQLTRHRRRISALPPKADKRADVSACPLSANCGHVAEAATCDNWTFSSMSTCTAACTGATMAGWFHADKPARCWPFGAFSSFVPLPAIRRRSRLTTSPSSRCHSSSIKKIPGAKQLKDLPTQCVIGRRDAFRSGITSMASFLQAADDRVRALTAGRRRLCHQFDDQLVSAGQRAELVLLAIYVSEPWRS